MVSETMQNEPYNSINDIVRDLETQPIESSGHIYHPIPFPEFSHLTTSSNRKQVNKKFDLITKALSELRPDGIMNLSVLDIGANAGFYTFSLAQRGAKVTAFESDHRYGPIGHFLAAEKRLPVTWHSAPYSPDFVIGQQFDVTLMLSVFQWMADGGKRQAEALDDLRAISGASRYLIFELGFNVGKSCLRTTKLNHYAELIRLLKENTPYIHFRLLGMTRLWKGAHRFLVLCSTDPSMEDGLFRRLLRQLNV